MHDGGCKEYRAAVTISFLEFFLWSIQIQLSTVATYKKKKKKVTAMQYSVRSP
jgi:hypothetical protein